MKKWQVNVSLMIILTGILLLASPAMANETVTDQTKKLDSTRTLRAQKVAAFKATFPRVKVETNPVTGGPEDLWGDLSKNQTKTEHIEAAYEFFEQNRELYGMTNPRQELKLQSSAKDEYGGMVDFKQLYNGVEIYRSTLRAYFKPDGKLSGVKGGFVTTVDVSTIPALDSGSALDLVKKDLKLPPNYKDPLIESKEKLTGRPSNWPPPPKLSIVNLKGKFYLAWVIRQPVGETFSDWEYFIDARSGAILKKEDHTVWENPYSRPSEKPQPAKVSPPPNPPIEKYEPLYPPRIETVKTAPQIVPELYQKMQDSLRKLEEKAWEEEARRHNMTPAEYTKYLEEEEKRRSEELLERAGLPRDYQPSPGTPEVKRPVPPGTPEARRPAMLIDSTGRDTIIIKFSDPSEDPESLRIECVNPPKVKTLSLRVFDTWL